MADVKQPAGLPLWSDYTGFVGKHRALIAILMVLGLMCGFALSTRQPSTYSATASVALAAVPKYVTDPNTELLAPTVSIDTEGQLLRSPQVMTAVASALGVDPTEAVDHLTVTAAPVTRVLRVTIRASSPEAAANAANAAVSTLTKVIRGTLGALQDGQLNQVRMLLATRQAEFASQQTRRVVIPATDDLFNEVAELQASLDELEAAHRSPTRVVQVAEPPRRHDYPNHEVPMMSGLMLGLLLGCVAGAIRDRSRVLALHTFTSPTGPSTTNVRQPQAASNPS